MGLQIRLVRISPLKESKEEAAEEEEEEEDVFQSYRRLSKDQPPPDPLKLAKNFSRRSSSSTETDPRGDKLAIQDILTRLLDEGQVFQHE